MAGFSTAVTGLKAATTDLDVTGNNIANASTVGFKSSRTEFGDVYAMAVVGAGSSNVAGSGVTVTDIAQDFQAGTLEFTNNNLDLAINGSGFFQLDDGQGGTTYTRAGAFELDKDGFIVSKTGKYLQGYEVNSEGGILPIGNLAVTEKYSRPNPTGNIDLSFNINSEEVTAVEDYDPNVPESSTYSTTVRTFNSIGSEGTIQFNMVEARPVQAQQQVTSLTTGDTISGLGINGTHMAELASGGYVDGDVISPGGLVDDLIAADPRIESVVFNGADAITLRFKSEFPEPDLVQVTGTATVAEIDEIDANETYTFPVVVTDAGGTLSADVVLEIGGVTLATVKSGSDADDIGEAVAASEAKILDANPNVESVTYDSATQTVVVTYKAESGDIEDGDAITITETSGSGAGLTTSPAVVKNGDNSFEGVYRMYAYLDGSDLLNIGKERDPGETGSGPEKGPILIKFDPTNGLLAEVNGTAVSTAGVAPTITIRGADTANPDTTIDLDISNTTQFASASIIKQSSQDGYPDGELVGVTFAPTGEMVASFSNGQSQDLGLVAIATFDNQAGLVPSGDTEWTATLASGSALVNPPGTGLNGTLQSAALEQSNVDLSAELVALIEAQRNFQANSKTLETLNTVTQNILQI
ncbi:flagellar hook-basal body complex protein [Neptuniibacter pectenicola]|uniref:Flagellar hook protein FlgE n=1 Tax=Neptuniibacter pectenicola TaxID=1806669 RepID=A0ABU9TVK9_9GAMM